MKVNLNQNVTVTLTSKGQNVLDQYIKDNILIYTNAEIPKYLKDAQSCNTLTCPLWEYMNIFGSVYRMGIANVPTVDNEIDIEVCNEQERVLCAAILRKSTKQVPQSPYHHNEILDIELGFRHHDIIIRFGDELLKSNKAQGFYTSYGRFVDRREAAEIAYKAGQISKPTSILFSEDLY